MTHRALLRMACAVPVAVALISCGGSPTATGPAAQQQPVGPAQVTDTGQVTSSAGGPATSSGSQARPAQTGGARPGGPGPGPGPGPVSGNGGGGRPGGPFDVEAFENRGQDLAGFRTFGADHCSGGRCVLVETASTDAAAQEGCKIAEFAYDPPARPAGAPPSEQFIQRGTTVTVFVHCPPAAGESGAAGSSSRESSTAESAGSGSAAATGSASESSSAGAGG